MTTLSRAFHFGWLLLMSAIVQAQKLEPYDAVRIVCPAHPSIEKTLFIGPFGNVRLPLDSETTLAGLPLDEAARRLRVLFEARLAAPLGRFDLVPAYNPNAPVRYAGALERSGETFATKGLRLSQVLSLAHPAANADLERIEIRAFDRTLKIDVRAISRPDTWDRELLPGDRIFVPEVAGGREIYVLGQVAQPRALDFEAGLTVKAAIEKAGGINALGDPSRIRIMRRQRLHGMLDLDFGDAPLEAGDVVVVDKRDDASYLYVVGAVVRPCRMPFRSGMTLLQALEEAGGVDIGNPKPLATLARLVRGKLEVKRYEIAALKLDRSADVPLQPGDRIEVLEPSR